MDKSNYFFGTSVFGQLISLIDARLINKCVRSCNSDYYVKRFKTQDHLISMLFCVMAKCSSLREVSGAMLGLAGKTKHFKLNSLPYRSTLSDANKRRGCEVFEQIYYDLLREYHWVISDSRFKDVIKKQVEIFDSSTITLFQEILKSSGRNPQNGKRKIQTAMKSSQNHPLTGIVHIDEFLIGEYEQGVVGRSHNSKKRLVIVALEIVEKGVGRAYAQVIERASAKEFKPFFNAYISKEAQVITDEWKGYLPLMKDYKKLEQRPSNKGANFKELHIHIMNIQGWLRGIHHHCDKENLQGYLDEYHFRYNRRSMMGSIFNLTLQKLIFHNVR